MKKELPSLPESKDNFWDEAEKVPTENLVTQDANVCSHTFTGNGNEVQCTKCYWGFYLTSETEFKDGHVFRVRDGFKLI